MNASVTATAVLVVAPLAAGLIGLLLPEPGRRRASAGSVSPPPRSRWLAAIGWRITVGRGTRRRVAASGSGSAPLDVTIGVTASTGGSRTSRSRSASVALAVQVYSVAYLRDDDRYPPYAAQVSLFTAAMLLVLVSGDLIVLLVGWEVMGICSYLLIGTTGRCPRHRAAAVKAFVVTRFGDVGFLLGIALLGLGAGTFRISTVLTDLPGQSPRPGSP